MSETDKYKVKWTTRFKKDYKLAVKVFYWHPTFYSFVLIICIRGLLKRLRKKYIAIGEREKEEPDGSMVLKHSRAVAITLPPFSFALFQIWPFLTK